VSSSTFAARQKDVLHWVIFYGIFAGIKDGYWHKACYRCQGYRSHWVKRASDP
ncbi:hypothetical protein S245_006127, partial [Arachis hypogaea]